MSWRTSQAHGVYRLTTEVRVRIVRNMDFKSLMVFRATAKDSFALVRRELEDSLDELLAEHVPYVRSFKQALLRYHGLVSGTVAVRFFLRLPPDPTDWLEVYMPKPTWCVRGMRNHILSSQDGTWLYGGELSASNGLLAGAGFETSQGLVDIYHSIGDAVIPICRAQNSALAAYVSPHEFGLAWPTLTLQGLYMPGDIETVTEEGSATMRHLGFRARLWPWMWPELGLSPQLCARHAYCCPAQPRMVTDKGFLRGTFDPIHVDRMDPTVKFRLCSRPCRSGCQLHEPDMGTHGVIAYL